MKIKHAYSFSLELISYSYVAEINIH